MPHTWHQLSGEQVIDHFRVTTTQGLTTSEVGLRRKTSGYNELPGPKRRPLIVIFIRQFLSPLIYLLLLATVIAFALGEHKDAMVILVVVILNAVIGSIQEGRAEQSLNALRKLSSLKAHVLRDGHTQEIEAREIVPGDILLLTAGDAVTSDARIIECSSAMVAEAALTGESMPVGKSSPPLAAETELADRANMVYAGTYITAGRALAVVTSIGSDNEIGRIAQLTTSAERPKTQLEIKVHDFGRHIAYAAVLLFLGVLAIGHFRGIPFTELFMLAVSQTVSLVPEGLPVALTIALAVGVQRMAKRKAIIRRLAAVESLGSTTIICTDKTGTLTKNEMTVVSVYLTRSARTLTVTGVGYEISGQILEIDPQDPELHHLLAASVLCNDAELRPPTPEVPHWHVLGDPTEGALVVLAEKAQVSAERLRRASPRTGEIPFNSDAKLMATEHAASDLPLVALKGALESLIPLCTNAPEDIARVQAAASLMAKSALRVLAIGHVPKGALDPSLGFEQLTGKVTLLGIVGQVDPPRQEVATSVHECLRAGIRPVIVTGDHKATALAIARTLGIGKDTDVALDGSELDRLSDSELDRMLGRVSVFARVRPAQKLRIVSAYQKCGDVVAMTGDGVNDAPALAQADVGVAMGITGTEVAKEAAKIVITDDNFATIVSAIAEGRLVYQNIKKLILFLFVTSIDEVLVLLFAMLAGYPPPLAAVQILWINLVSEGALTINLIMEPPEGDEMDRRPVAVDEPLLDRTLLRRMPLMVSAAVASTFGWFLYRTHSGVPAALVQSETFTILVVGQWFNVLNCRSATRSALSVDFLKNPWLVGGLVVANLLHALVIYWPPLAAFFHTTPIETQQFFLIGVVASLVLWVEELRKFLLRRRMA